MSEYLDAHCIASDGEECVKPEVSIQCDADCCSDDDCRGSLVCSEGRCARSTSVSQTDSDGGCSSDDDCRGTLECTDGVCGRGSSGQSGSGKGSGGGRPGANGARMEVVDPTTSSESDSAGSVWRSVSVLGTALHLVSFVFWQSVLWIWSVVSALISIL